MNPTSSSPQADFSQAASSHTSAPPVAYALEPQLAAAEFIDLLVRSTLASRRPVEDPERIVRMLQGADIVLTARSGARLVGVSRAITDFAYCTYLADLAVDQDFQRQGIGKELIQRTHNAAGLATTLILLAAPAAREYYPHIGMQPHDSCWILPRQATSSPGTPADVPTRSATNPADSA